MKLSELQPLESMMALFKGESGGGKTTALASYPKPMYVADLDGRIRSLVSNPWLKPYLNDIEFDTFVDYRALYEKLEEFQQNCPYKTFALDGLTTFARMVIDFLFDNRGATQAQRTNKNAPMKTVGLIPVMDIEEYSGESSGIAQVLTKLRIIRNHGCNVIMTAHVVTTETKTLAGTSQITRRLLTGGNKIAAEIPAYFDEIYHFSARPDVADAISGSGSGKVKYIAGTRNSGTDYARTTFMNLPNEIDFTGELFYDKLINLIKE